MRNELRPSDSVRVCSYYSRVKINIMILDPLCRYANSISKYPQLCLNRDRMSAYHAMYDAKDFETALQYEMQQGLDVLLSESVAGAQQFVSGVGKHGSFNLHGMKSVRDKGNNENNKSKL